MKQLSIIIPTQNTPYTLVCFLRYAEVRFSSNSEIIISISGGASEQYTTYLSTWKGNASLISLDNAGADMVQNFNYALSKARGEYICFIGGDDAVSVYAEKLVEFMRRKHIQCLTPKVLVYEWPNKEKKETACSIGAFKAGIDGFDFERSLSLLCQNGGFGPHNFPKLYYGIIEKSLLEKIKIRYGDIFGCPSPDAYAFLRIGKYLKTYQYIDLPIFIGGYSISSNSGRLRVLSGRASRRVSNLSFLKPLKLYKIVDGLPDYFSPETAWPTMMAKLIEDLLGSEYSKKIRLEHSLAKLLVHGEGVKFETFSFVVKRHLAGNLNKYTFFRCVYLELKGKLRRGVKCICRWFLPVKRVKGFENISDALDALDKRLESYYKSSDLSKSYDKRV